MPMYEYRCAAGHTFEVRGKIDGSDAPTACTVPVGVQDLNGLDPTPCNQPVEKQLSAPSRHFPGADSWQKK